MKQFSLEEYVKNPSRKVVTRDGSKVRIICTDKKGACPIVALIERSDGVAEETVTYAKNGEFFGDSSYKYDLFFAPEKHEGWVNVCKSQMYRCGLIHNSEEEARRSRGLDAIATVKIEWEK